eukprot:jgi/Bigna1/78210/fgenesh1_pg.53_\
MCMIPNCGLTVTTNNPGILSIFMNPRDCLMEAVSAKNDLSARDGRSPPRNHGRGTTAMFISLMSNFRMERLVWKVAGQGFHATVATAVTESCLFPAKGAISTFPSPISEAIQKDLRVLKPRKGLARAVGVEAVAAAVAGSQSLPQIRHHFPRKASPFKVNQMITGSRNISEIMEICRFYDEHLTHINVVSAFHRIAKLSTWGGKKTPHRQAKEGIGGNDGLPPLKGMPDHVKKYPDATHGGGMDRPPPLLFGTEEWGVLDSRLQDKVMLLKLNAQGIANLLWALAKLSHPSSRKMLLEIQDQAADISATFNGQNVANTLWAYATMEMRPNLRLLDAMLTRIKVDIDEYRPQSMANILWALAKSGIGRSSSFAISRKEEEVGQGNAVLNYDDTQKTDSESNRSIAQVAATTKLMMETERKNAETGPADDNYNSGSSETLLAETIEALQGAVVASINDLKMQEIANSLWAVAKLNECIGKRGQPEVSAQGQEVTQALMEAAEARLKHPHNTVQLNLQDLDHVLWAFGALRHRPQPEAMEAFEDREQELLPFVRTSESLVRMLQNFARVVYSPGDGFMEEFRERLENLTPAPVPEHLASIGWALGRIGTPTDARFGSKDGIEASVFKVLELRALESTNVMDAETAIVAESNSNNSNGCHSHSLSPSTISRFLWAYAKLRIVPGEEFLTAVHRSVRERLVEFQPADIARAMWALGRIWATVCDLQGQNLISSSSSSSSSTTTISTSTPPSEDDNDEDDGDNLDEEYKRGDGAARSYKEDFKEKEDDDGTRRIEGGTDYAGGKTSCLIEAISMELQLRAGEKNIVDKFGGKEIGDFLKGLTMLDIEVMPSVLAGLEKQSIAVVPGEQAQQMQPILFRLVQLSVSPGMEFLEAFSCHFDVGSLTPRRTADLLWAFAKIRTKLVDSEENADEEFLSGSAYLPPSTVLIDSVQASTKFGELVKRVLAIAEGSCDNYLPRDVPDVLSAIARLNHNMPKGALESFEARIVSDINKYSPNEIATAFWAFAVMERDMGEDTRNVLQRRAVTVSKDFTPEMARVLMWAFARLDFDPDRRLVLALHRALVV